MFYRAIVKGSCTLVPRLGSTATLQQHGLVGEFAAEYVENLHRGAVGPCLEVNVGLRLLHSARGPFIPCLLCILLHRQSPGLVLALHACFLVPFHNRSLSSLVSILCARVPPPIVSPLLTAASVRPSCLRGRMPPPSGLIRLTGVPNRLLLYAERAHGV